MRVRVVTSAAVLAAVLSGCSVAGTDFQPGVAATVGDETITNDEVDRLTTAACGAFGPQLAAQSQVLPLRQIKATVVQNLALGAAVRQLGSEYGVEPGETYRREVSSAVGTEDLSADERDAVVVVSTTEVLVTDILGQVGAEVAAAAGDGGAEAAPPAAEQAVQLGGEELNRWLADNEIEVDPQYGLDISETGSTVVDTSLAFGVSRAARAGEAETVDPAATMALPESQRCGSVSAAGGAG